MAIKRFADRFYVSGAWKAVRAAYLAEHPLCERCLAMGIAEAATEVHHKIKLTPGNINDPNVALNWENLEALSDACHKARHADERPKRVRVDESGHVTIEEAPP